MKTLYLDCSMGAAGDMLTAALLELVPEPSKYVEQLNALGIPGVEYRTGRAVKCGITGTQVSVYVNGGEEHSHDHSPTHGHPHSHAAGQGHIHTHEAASDLTAACEPHEDHEPHAHPHRGMREITHLIGELSLPQNVKEDVLAVYRRIAEAESHVHGIPATEIHFHEVGTMDAIADVAAVCFLMHCIQPDEVIVSPVHVGSGQVRCAHGILPVPAPATAYLLREVPIYSGAIRGELCTPTGAALLTHFATRFGDMPLMRTQAIGYGMGQKDFEAANCVRAMLGESGDRADVVCELSCNVDDMTAEEIGFAMERLLACGALEVFTVPVGMKKSRPGTLLTVLCRKADREEMIKCIFRHTTTIGVREAWKERYVLDRKEERIQTPYGEVRCKVSTGYGVTRRKPEYEDIARIAREQGTGIRELREALAPEGDIRKRI